MSFSPQFGETRMSLQARIWELQQIRATILNEQVRSYCDRRIAEIQAKIDVMDGRTGDRETVAARALGTKKQPDAIGWLGSDGHGPIVKQSKEGS